MLEPDDPRLNERVRAATDGLGAGLVLEAAGTPSSLPTAVASARKGGKIVVLGVVREEVPLDYRSIRDIVSRGFVPLVERPREFVKIQVSATRDATTA